MLYRLAARPALRAATAAYVRPLVQRPQLATPLSRAVRFYSSDDLSYEEFSKKFEQEFDDAYDVYEVQRVLNNVFAYDLVPAPTVLEHALKAARRVNDYATASRVFEALRSKVESKSQYDAYLAELHDIREELGITLHEDLFKEE